MPDPFDAKGSHFADKSRCLEMDQQSSEVGSTFSDSRALGASIHVQETDDDRVWNSSFRNRGGDSQRFPREVGTDRHSVLYIRFVHSVQMLAF